MFGCITGKESPCSLFLYLCDRECTERGLHRETLWSLNSFTQSNTVVTRWGVCEMISEASLYFKALISFALKALPFGTSVRFAQLRLLALCYL